MRLDRRKVLYQLEHYNGKGKAMKWDREYLDMYGVEKGAKSVGPHRGIVTTRVIFQMTQKSFPDLIYLANLRLR